MSKSRQIGRFSGGAGKLTVDSGRCKVALDGCPTLLMCENEPLLVNLSLALLVLMNRIVPIGIVVVLAVAVLAVLYFTSASNPTPHAPQTYFEKQMFVTVGILSASVGSTQLYQLTTTVRFVGGSYITNMTASIDISGTGSPIVVSKFYQGLTPISPTVPLGYNVTANAQGTDLTPPSGGFHLGQSFPESLAITLRNGTTVQLSVAAPVYSPSS